MVTSGSFPPKYESFAWCTVSYYAFHTTVTCPYSCQIVPVRGKISSYPVLTGTMRREYEHLCSTHTQLIWSLSPPPT